jgi:hypothetical protein
MRLLVRVCCRTLSLAAFVLAGNPRAAQSQAQSTGPTASFDAMRLPGQQLRCTIVSPPNGAPAGAKAFDFGDGVDLVNDRTITVVYDSTGDPLALQMLATEVRDSRPLWHALVVAYPTSHSEQGFEMIGPAGLVPSSAQQDLSKDTLTKARALSTWLWNHQCRKAD